MPSSHIFSFFAQSDENQRKGAKAISRSRGGLYDCRSSIFFFESFSYCNYIFVVLKSNLFCLAGKSHDPHIHSLLGRLHLSGLFIGYLHAYADQQAYFIVQFLVQTSWSFKYRFSAKLVPNNLQLPILFLFLLITDFTQEISFKIVPCHFKIPRSLK